MSEGKNHCLLCKEPIFKWALYCSETHEKEYESQLLPTNATIIVIDGQPHTVEGPAAIAINRQKAENERLQATIISMGKSLDKWAGGGGDD